MKQNKLNKKQKNKEFNKKLILFSHLVAKNILYLAIALLIFQSVIAAVPDFSEGFKIQNNSHSNVFLVDLSGNVNFTGGLYSDDYIFFDDDVNISGFLNITKGLSVDSNTLYVDSGANNVGIGTSSPDSILDVATAANDEGLVITNGAIVVNRITRNSAGDGIIVQYNSSGSLKNVFHSNGNSYFNGGNVGIGTSSPSEKFSVESGNIVLNSSYNITFGNAKIGTGSGGNTIQIFSANSANELIVYDSSGNIDFIVDNNGEVGIGTTSPGTKLDVNGSSARVFSDTGSSSVIIGGTTGTGSSILLRRGSGTAGWTILRDGTDSEKLKLRWGEVAGTSEFMTITNTGDVGIGTTSPASILHVNGSNSGNIAVRIENNNTAGDIWTLFHQAGTQKGFVGYDDSSDTIALSYGTTSANNHIRIDNAGNVGIGTSSPEAGFRVTIDGAAGSTGGLRILPNASSSGFQMSSNGIFNIDSAGVVGGRFRILENGNVGIGTTSPATKLHIVGDSATPTLSSASAEQIITGNSPQLFFDEADGAADNQLWDFLADSVVFQGRVVNDANNVASTWLRVQRSGTTVTNIAFPNGNVGIGTSSPNRQLTISGGTPEIQFNDTDDSGSDWHIGQQGDDFSITETNVAIRLIILNGGNVGIGTTTPQNTLDVVGTGNITSNFTVGNDALFIDTVNNRLVIRPNGASTIIPHTDGNVYITGDGDVGDGDIIFRQFAVGAFTEHMVIDGITGNVGIGTTSPTNQLTLLGNADPNIGFIGATNTNNWTIGVDNSDSGKFKIANTTEGNSLDTNAVFTIDKSNGNVGIGTTSPSYKLHLNGSSSTGIRIDDADDGRPGVIEVNDSTMKIWMSGGSANAGNITFLTGSGSGTERIRITGDGNVGIGTATPAGIFHSSGTWFMSNFGGGAGSGYVCYSSSNDKITTSASCGSSLSVKENVADLSLNGQSALDIIAQLRPVQYNFKSLGEFTKQNKTYGGFIAEEAALTSPLLVNYDDNGTIDGLNYDVITTFSVKAIQELKSQMQELCLRDSSYSWC